MDLLNRFILMLLIVGELQNYYVNSIQLFTVNVAQKVVRDRDEPDWEVNTRETIVRIINLFLVYKINANSVREILNCNFITDRRIVRQFGHPPFEQIILKPAFQPIHPHRAYHPIIKYDETPVNSNPHVYHHYDPSFGLENSFQPISNPNLFQPVDAYPNAQVQNFYPVPNHPIKSNQYKVQKPYYHEPKKQPLPTVRYSKPRAKPNYNYHNPTYHYIPLSHDHHQNYQDEYHQNYEDHPSIEKGRSPPAITDHADIKEVSTKHITNMASVKMMNGGKGHNKHNDDDAVVEEEPLDRPDVSKTTGPVFTYVKTDPNANIKWGVRHYVGRKYN